MSKLIIALNLHNGNSKNHLQVEGDLIIYLLLIFK
jgi:hypothetical protein